MIPDAAVIRLKLDERAVLGARVRAPTMPQRDALRFRPQVIERALKIMPGTMSL